MSGSEHTPTFRPRILGELEEAIMDVLWSAGAPISVKEVLGRLERGLAYTTVMTTLDRLYRKGLVNREKDGMAFLYIPAFTRTEFQQHLMAGLLGEMLPESGDALLAAFVDLAAQADESNLDRLDSLIAAFRKGHR